MRKSKLVKVLQLLTAKEHKQLKYFLQSPYHNRNKNCLLLYELLHPFAPSFDSEKLDAPSFTKKIYTNKRSMYTLSNELVRLVEDFLIWEGLKEKSGIKKYLLLEKLKSKRVPKLFEGIYQTEKNGLLKKKRQMEDYHRAYLLEMSRLEMLYGTCRDRTKLSNQLTETVMAFGKYSFSGHLMMDNIIFNMLRSGVTEEVGETLKELIPTAQTFSHGAEEKMIRDNDAFIQLHLLLRQMYRSQEEGDFILFFEFLKTNHTGISKKSKDFFNKVITNFCLNKIMEGDANYYRQALDAYLFAIDTGAFMKGEYLDSIRLKNIIVVSVKSGQIKSAHDLLNKYIPLVHPKFQEVTESYCRGYLYYLQEEFDLALETLGQCIALKSLFELDAQTMLYKIYYETEEDWAFDIPVQSFIIRLSRQGDKHPKDVIQGYLNFFRVLKQVYRKKREPNYRKKKETLLAKMDSMKYISDKQWLLQKLEELES